MEEYLTFRKLLVPVLIQVIFWAVVLVFVVAGLVMIVRGASATYGGGGYVLHGVLMLVLGPIVVRIWCEALIVLFRIHDTLNEIAKKGRGEKS